MPCATYWHLRSCFHVATPSVIAAAAASCRRFSSAIAADIRHDASPPLMGALQITPLSYYAIADFVTPCQRQALMRDASCLLLPLSPR